jgi:hypothetical protein
MKTVWFIGFYLILLLFGILTATQLEEEAFGRGVLFPISFIYLALLVFHLVFYWRKRQRKYLKPSESSYVA